MSESDVSESVATVLGRVDSPAASPDSETSGAPSMRLAYADPPYPGCADYYPEKTEVDHAELVTRLCEYDGWALSTNENALQPILGIAPPGVRVLAWCKSNAPPFFGHPVPSWEPVICMPARTDARPERIRNYLVSPAPSGFVNSGTALIGKKSPAFCEWVIRCLGAEPDDTLDDLFPGTGIMSETWDRWRRAPSLWSAPTGGSLGKREKIRRSYGGYHTRDLLYEDAG